MSATCVPWHVPHGHTGLSLQGVNADLHAARHKAAEPGGGDPSVLDANYPPN